MIRRLAILGLALGIVATGACRPSDTTTPKRASPSTTGPRSASPLRTAAGDTALVQSLGVQQADVPSGNTVLLIANGDKVEGAVTLDLCSADFPSEELRTARRQVAVADSQLQTRLSTEAVLYKNPAATQQVFDELRDVRARCPDTFVAPANSDVVPIKTTFNPPPDTRWPQTPGVDRLAFDLTLTDTEGRSTRTVAVYLRRGRVLLGVYFPRPDQPPLRIAGNITMQTIVQAFAERLKRLPASAVS